MIRRDVAAEGTPPTFWVIGGGRFGGRAVDYLRRKEPAGRIVVVDKVSSDRLPAGIEMIRDDGVAWLAAHFTHDAIVDAIIPALPLHLAADWLHLKLGAAGRITRVLAISDDVLCRLPHPLRLSASRAALSHADFICPDNCPEPERLCTTTGKPRPAALYHILETLDADSFVPLILRSRQFFPGVGGFFPDDLWSLYHQAESMADTPLLIGTACKCHGIIDGLSRSSRSKI